MSSSTSGPAPTDGSKTRDPLLDVAGLSKRFGSVQALRGASLQVRAGEIMALCGENGAGKSTLVKILIGVHQPDEGVIRIDGREVSIRTPREGQALGLALVSQELSLAADLSVEDNIWLGARNVPMLHRRRRLRDRARQVAHLLGFEDGILERKVATLSIAERQLVEIARNLCREARILILDEPSATLSDVDIARMMAALRRLRDEGCGIVYISHRLGEIFQLCDRVTVLRNGEVAGARAISDLDRDELIGMMVGKPLEALYPPPGPARAAAAPLLEVGGLSIPGVVRDVSFSVAPGQIVGIAGQIGSGAAELVRALAGLIPQADGRLVLNGRQTALKDRAGMRDCGIAFVSDDRAGEGLFLHRPVRENLVVTQLSSLSRRGWLSWAAIDKVAGDIAGAIGVDPRRLRSHAGELSGGNQQKVAIGRCIHAAAADRDKPGDAGLLLMNEPTRGVDVGARSDIYRLMRAFCARGYGIVMHTTDLEELVGMADVVLTLYRGDMVGSYPRAEATVAGILSDITHTAVPPSRPGAPSAAAMQ